MDPAMLADQLDWLDACLAARLETCLGSAAHGATPGTGALDDPTLDRSAFAQVVGGEPLSASEHALILLALVPHVRPEFFGQLIGRYLPEGGDLPEFGGVRVEQHRGILPTGETAQFVLAGENLAERLAVQRLLSGEHWLARRHVLWLDDVREGEPVMSGRLILDAEVVERITTGTVSLPRFGADFPAEHLESELEWDDVVLPTDTLRRVHEIENWVRFNDVIMDEWSLGRRVRPGYRALFHGPPGTGKTLTAALLGKVTGRPVFRIDLSRVVSKFIGETEKNLARLFDRAEHKDWILFFDEADALFGKRTDVRDAHDKYANQEVAYLLQRIEGHAGLVILATNQRGNIDEAFLRRFQTAIHFPMPRPEDRHAIWLRTFPAQIAVSDDVDWREIAGRFELTGAGIVNVAHFCAIEALAQGTRAVNRAFLEAAIMRELVKEGKLV